MTPRDFITGPSSDVCIPCAAVGVWQEQVKAVLETMAFILPMQLMGPQAIPLLEEVLGWTMPPDFTGFPHKKAAKHLTSLVGFPLP